MSLIVGAYPAQPSIPADREAFFTELADEPAIRGLELPHHRDDGDPWPPGAPAAWTAVVTAIPGTMQHLARDPYFGLASTDPQGRAAALRYAADIHDYARSLTAQHHRVEAIELRSAPRGHGSAEALDASLIESCPGIGTVPESPSNTVIPQPPVGSPRKASCPSKPR